MNRLDYIWWIALTIILIRIAFSLYVALSNEHQPATALAWLLILAVLPGLGIVLYLLFGRSLRCQRLFDQKRTEEMTQFRVTAEEQTQIESAPDAVRSMGRANEEIAMMQFLLTAANSTVTGDNTVEVISHGEEHSAMLLRDLGQAKHFIHLQYFIIHNDMMGKQILQLLEQRAAAGVEVKVLYDAVGSLRLPKDFFANLQRVGGQAAAFLPPSLRHSTRLNFRNHRKICVVDGQVAYVGGFNIGDEYAGHPEKFSAWRDLHLRIMGGAVENLESRFWRDWRFVTKSSQRSRDCLPEQRSAEGKVNLQIVVSGPDTKWQPVKEGLLKMINLARQHVYLETPYFIPDSSLIDALRLAALSGVEVKVILPGHPDHPMVLPAGMSYLGDLLEAGVRFFFYQPGFLHSKMLSVDGRISTVGSSNFDLRSFRLNFEVNAFIYDDAVTSKLEAIFADDLSHSDELTLEQHRSRGRWQRAKEALARLLAPML